MLLSRVTTKLVVATVLSVNCIVIGYRYTGLFPQDRIWVCMVERTPLRRYSCTEEATRYIMYYLNVLHKIKALRGTGLISSPIDDVSIMGEEVASVKFGSDHQCPVLTRFRSFEFLKSNHPTDLKRLLRHPLRDLQSCEFTNDPLDETCRHERDVSIEYLHSVFEQRQRKSKKSRFIHDEDLPKDYVIGRPKDYIEDPLWIHNESR